MSLSSGLMNRLLDRPIVERSIHRWRTLVRSDRDVACARFESVIGYPPNLAAPRTFCEKITWLLLEYRPPWLAPLADKYEVRAYVEKNAGTRYLNPMIGLYGRVEEINWSSLPDAFALKATHGSKWNILCPDRASFDPATAEAKCRRWLKENFYWYGREWIYRPLKHRLICEEFLADERGQSPADYKIFCFGGDPRLIQMDEDRFVDHKRGFFTSRWEPLDATMTYPPLVGPMPPPPRLEEMLDIARRLSAGIPFVRVDLYELADRVVFGELTFLPGRGVEPFAEERFNLEFGDWIQLPAAHPDHGIWSRLPAVFG